MQNILYKKVGLYLIGFCLIYYILGFASNYVRNLNDGDARTLELLFEANRIKIGRDFKVINFYTERYLLGDCALFYELEDNMKNREWLEFLKIEIMKQKWVEENSEHKNMLSLKKKNYKLKILFLDNRYLFHFTDCRSNIGSYLYGI